MLEDLNPLCICYHGTDGVAAKAIQEDGFKGGTYFAKHLEDAIEFGGWHIFEVSFSVNDLPNHSESWQFRIGEVVPPDRIVSHRIYGRITEFQNEELRVAIFKSNAN